MFCSVKDSYAVFKKPALRTSDHNMLYCMAIYKEKLQTYKRQKLQLRKWSNDCSLTLQDCFDSTDFSALYDNKCDISYNGEVVTGYLDLCVSMVVPKKV